MRVKVPGGSRLNVRSGGAVGPGAWRFLGTFERPARSRAISVEILVFPVARRAPELRWDARARRVIVDGERPVDLRRRPLLARMLEVLLERSPGGLAKDDLFRRVWHAEFDPGTRSAALYKAVDRLARLLSPEDPRRFLVWDEKGHLVLRAG